MRRLFDVRRPLVTIAALLVCCGIMRISEAAATPAITMDVATGEVLFQEDATQRWYPASTTKLMTVFVALSAVRDHQIALDTPLVVSARAHAMPPSKMGFPIGTQVTLDNALKMLMVRSANDVAITVAEGIAGSVEAFAEDMNQTAAQLGMRESHFANPNGLPDASHVSSARDMAILARALYTQFPQEAGLFNLGELTLGAERIANHNNLLGRYPGVDGMKTGFTCAAGFNVVASAYRDGRRVVVVVFGAPSVAMRTQKVAALLDRAFMGIDRPITSILTMPTAGSAWAPDMRDQVCRGRGRLIAAFGEEVAQLDAPLMSATSAPVLGASALNPERSFLFNTNGVASISPMSKRIGSMPTPVFEPVPVHIGADSGYTGVVAQARMPHTAIGTETPPVTVEAYAASQPTRTAGPLGIDPKALPLKGRRVKAARVRSRNAPKAVAEAPVTKVIAGKDGEDPAAEAAKAPPAKKRVATTKASKTTLAHLDKDASVKNKSVKERAAKDTAAESPSKDAPTKKSTTAERGSAKVKKVAKPAKTDPGQAAAGKAKVKSADGA